MIEPTHLELEATDGLALGAMRLPASPGLHVLFGANNAGKSRLLRLMSLARFGRELDIVRDYAYLPDGAGQLLINQGVTTVGLTWNGRADESQANDSLVLDDHVMSVLNRNDTSLVKAVRKRLKGLLRSRVAQAVPTSRYFRERSDLGTTPSFPDCTGILYGLQRSPDSEKRAVYERINERFRDIMDSLTLAFFGEGAMTGLYIVEKGQAPRALDECGDGLRDLLAILLFTSQYPTHDLLLEDPGLRLHPTAQRKLLAYLREEANIRAIWMATHEAVFLTTPAVVTRWAVRREAGTTIVSAAATPNDMREAALEIGWQPEEAFFATKVLFCEGESDQLVFEHMLRLLSKEEPLLGGVVVARLAGEGALLAREKDGNLSRTVDLTRRIAAHAELYALLDRGKRTQEEIARIERTLATKGVRVSFLEKPELESYWLMSVVQVRDLLGTVRQRFEERSGRQPGPMLSNEQIAATLKKRPTSRQQTARQFSMTSAGR